MMRWVAIAMIAGCGRFGFDPTGGGVGGGSADSSLQMGSGGGVMGNGTGIATGTPPFGDFSTIKAAYVIGNPAAPGEMAIYMLSSAMACDQLHPSGWENTMPTPTSVLELVVAGEIASLYPVQTTRPPPIQRAWVMDHYAPGGGSGTSNTSAQSGTITVVAVYPDGSAQGAFQIDFYSGYALQGVFSAAYCATGTPP